MSGAGKFAKCKCRHGVLRDKGWDETYWTRAWAKTER